MCPPRPYAAGDAAVFDVADRALVHALARVAVAAAPLNPQRKSNASGGSLKLGATTIALDTEHYAIDAKAVERRRALQADVLGDVEMSPRDGNVVPDVIDDERCPGLRAQAEAPLSRGGDLENS